MPRIIAIDYGKKRTGLAVTDELQIVPGALDTVETHRLFEYLEKYIQSESATIQRHAVGEHGKSQGV